MLGAVRRWFLKVRLEAAFAKCERQLKRLHLEEAASRFDTSQLEDGIQRAESLAAKEINDKFGLTIARAIGEEKTAQAALHDAEWEFQLFHRDFKSELAPLYDALKCVKAELSAAYEEKSDAYDRLSSAKSHLDSWFDKSDRHFFGNRGRELPRHSIFGQSLSDRDYYKRERDSAAWDIRSAKNDIARLKGQKAEIGAQIGAIKCDRDDMFALRDLGINRKAVSEQLATAQEAASRKRSARQIVEARRDEFRVVSRRGHCIPELMKDLERIKSARRDFELSFSHPDERAKRKKSFEACFLARERGV